MTELRIRHVVGIEIPKPRMVKRVVEVGAHLPAHSFLNRKLLVHGHIPDVQDLASHVGEYGGEVPQSEWRLRLGWEKRRVEPDVISRIELGAAQSLRRGVSGAVMQVGCSSLQGRRVREG